MNDNWILNSLKAAEQTARERSKELHREANNEQHRAKLLHNAAVQLENDQYNHHRTTTRLE